MWLADLPDGHRARPLSKELESEQLDLLAMLAGQSSVSRPNGSRLSCGRPARRRKSSGRQSVPARAQHSASLKAITARQLQALVRRHSIPASGGSWAQDAAQTGQEPIGVRRAEQKTVAGGCRNVDRPRAVSQIQQGLLPVAQTEPASLIAGEPSSHAAPPGP